jgi:hypothetical protein
MNKIELNNIAFSILQAQLLNSSAQSLPSDALGVTTEKYVANGVGKMSRAFPADQTAWMRHPCALIDIPGCGGTNAEFS